MTRFTVRLYDDSHSAFESIEADSLAQAISLAESLCRSFAGDGVGGWDIVPPDDELTDKPLASGTVEKGT